MEKSRTFARLLRDNSIKFKPQINKILKKNCAILQWIILHICSNIKIIKYITLRLMIDN